MPDHPWIVRDKPLAGNGLRAIMGILNTTPDSFSDGGRFVDVPSATEHARKLVAQGAAILDIGGESSRPGARPVPLEIELERVLPVTRSIAPGLGVPISIDTAKPEVARQALRAGASIVNDITGLRDPAMRAVVAKHSAGAVIMHMAGTPATMQDRPHYQDVVKEVHEFLASAVDAAEAAGIPRARIAVDPGIGFGKTFEHNLTLLRNLDRLRSIGCSILVGVSRKKILEGLTGKSVDERMTATVVASLAALAKGADVVRVHDVAAMRDALAIWDTLVGWSSSR
jgi:dihydropteroate synthase